MSDSPLDYSDYVTIKITKVKYYGEPSHWLVDITDPDGEIGAGTAPTFNGAMDIAHNAIYGGYKNNWDINEWATFDANAK